MDPHLSAVLLTILLLGVVALPVAGLAYWLEDHFNRDWDDMPATIVGILGAIAIGLGGFGLFSYWLYHKVLPWVT